MKASAAYFLTLVLFTSGCATWSYLGYKISPDYPKEETEMLDLPGLSEPVTVTFDQQGVPHVVAQSELDLLRTVGFLHGRSRFFQMDTIRRYAQGRLSELVGIQKVILGTTVDLDMSMRSWGFDRLCREEVKALDPESKKLMTAYVEGVNAALERYEPIEYSLLRVKPKPWSIADSFSVGYMIAWGITHNWRHEACRLILALQVGWERAEKILPPEPWPGEVSIKDVGEPTPLPPSVAPELHDLFPERNHITQEHTQHMSAVDRIVVRIPDFDGASNGWVLGGGRTNSGKPMVVGDPHLPHTVPSIFFQQHLKSPGMDVIGVTIPGIPYVLIGHNRQVAWTLTSAVADVIDLYIEKKDPEDPQKVIGPSGPEPLSHDVDTIFIKEGTGYRERKVNIRCTPRGPLLNDVLPELLPKHSPLVSIHGMPLRAVSSIRSLRRAGFAGNVNEFREAMMGFVSPINTVAAADKSGDIILFSTGSVPIRRHHRGTFPAPAWSEKYQWKETATTDQMPLAISSGNNYFVHTNNLMTYPGKQPIIFQIDSAPSYRRDRIVELIEATDRHSFETNAKIQSDVLLLRAKRVLPQMLKDLEKLKQPTQLMKQALLTMHEWDYYAEADSTATAVFFATYRSSIIGALEDEIDEKGMDFLLSFRYFTNAVDLWFDDPDHPVWDNRLTEDQEKRSDVVCAAFRKAILWLDKRLGGDPKKWHWGELHDLRMDHTLGSKVDSFNLKRWHAPGSSATVWKAHFDMSNSKHPFRNKYGPVLRFIVDLDEVDHAWWVVDTGTSGWPYSPHYDDQYELWKQVKYTPMVMNWKEIRRSAKGVLTLK